jgi:hypothetical protein
MPRYSWAIVGLVWMLVLGGFAYQEGRLYRRSLASEGSKRFEGRNVLEFPNEGLRPAVTVPVPAAPPPAAAPAIPSSPAAAPAIPSVPPGEAVASGAASLPAVAPPAVPPGAAAPSGTIPPGAIPPGAIPPGAIPPGTTPPAALPPGAAPPGGVPVVAGSAPPVLPPEPSGRPVGPAAPAPPALPPPPPWPTLPFHKEPTELSAEEELKLGRALRESILVRHPSVLAGPLLSRIQNAAAPALAERRRKEITYVFTLMDSDSINVFSHPGGFVYVSMGLLNLVASDAELQFVLAREIAHVDQRHAAQAMRGAGSSGESNLVRRAYRQIAAGYSPEQEYQADLWAYSLLRKQGKSRRESLAFLRRLVPYVDRHGGASAPVPSNIPPGADLEPIENHWLTAPAASDRLERLTKLSVRPQ